MARDLTDVLYPQTQTPSAWRTQLNLDSLEVEQDLPKGLLTSVLRAESAGNPQAKSSAGAAGLFQLMPDTARHYKADPYHPEEAAVAAATELGTLYRKYDGDLPSVLASWNWGQGNVDKQGLARAPAETRGFIAKVLGSLGPRSAEAAERQPVKAAEPRSTKGAGRDLTEQLFGSSGAAPSAPPQRQALPAPAPSVPPQRQALPASAPSVGVSPSGGLTAQPALPGQAATLLAPLQPVGRERVMEAAFPRTKDVPLLGTQADLPALPATIHEPGYKAVAGMGVQGLTTAAGAVVGGLGGPLSPATVPLGAGVGSYYGHRLNQALGLTPDATPETTEILPRTFDDYLQLGLPMAPLALPAARQVLRWTRGGRAITAADEATLEALKKYQADYAAHQMQYVDELEGQFATRRAQVANARTKALEDTRAAIDAWETEGFDAYKQAENTARASQAAYADALTQVETQRVQHQQAVQQQGAAVERLQALPEKYQPALPGRTMTDVRRDMAMPEQGGTSADAVVKRLGATDIADASAKLADEGNTFMQQGQSFATRPGESLASPYKQPQPSLPQQGPELQTFIRQQGGLKLTDEELQGEFAGLISRKETGLRLQNNRSGKTAQQIAEAAQEQGFIATADKDALLDALRRSVTEGKPVYSRLDAIPESPSALPAAKPPSATMPTGGRADGHQASRVLYQRLEEVAPSASVDLAPIIGTAMDMQAELAKSMPAMQPSRLNKIVDDLVTMKDRGSVTQVHQALKDLGPLTRSNDSRTRYLARQLRTGLQDSLEQSSIEWPETAGAAQLLKQANSVWRQESAVLDLRELFTVGGPIVKQRSGVLSIDPDALFNRVEREIGKEHSFLGALPAEQLAALRADIASFQGTPKVPTTTPRLPTPPDAAPLPGLMPGQGPRPGPIEPHWKAKELRPVEIEPPAFQKDTPLTGEVRVPSLHEPVPFPAYTPPAPVEPHVKSRMGSLIKYGAIPTMISAAGGQIGPASLVMGGLMTREMMSHALAKFMIHPARRQWFLHQLRSSGGEITPGLYSALGVVAAEEGSD